MRFDTIDMVGLEAFETYRSRGWPGFAGAFDISGDVDRFFYRSTILPAPQVTAYSFEISGLEYRRGAGERRDYRDHVLIQSARTGGAAHGEMAGMAFSRDSGRLGVVDFAADCSQRTLDTRADCLLLDRDLFRPGEAEQFRGFRWRSGGDALMADYMVSLTASPTNSPPSAAAVMTVLRACKGGDADAVEEARPLLSSLAADRARRYVRLHLQDQGMRPQTIAAAVGVSRATLYRLFSADGGVAAMMQRERLAAAAKRLLDSTGAPVVTTVAYDTGFADAAHFSRAFRSRYGLRPIDLIQHRKRR